MKQSELGLLELWHKLNRKFADWMILGLLDALTQPLQMKFRAFYRLRQ